MITIYALINNYYDMIFYVGSTKQTNPEKRKHNAKERARNLLRKSKKEIYIRECNFNIGFVILEQFENDELKRYEREQFYIDLYKPVGNTTGAKSIPPRMAGHNRQEFSEQFYSLLGTMPDYVLAEKFNTNKKTVMRQRHNRKIPSYASSSGNDGKIKKGEEHRRWKMN